MVGFGQENYWITDSTRHVMPIDTTPTMIIPGSNSSADSGLKLSFWIHGLAGDIQSWERVASVTEVQSLNSIPGYPERNTLSFVLDYSDLEAANNLDAIAANMALWMENEIGDLDSLDERKNIAVAHSQGGLVGRAIRFMTETDSRYNESYGALATFGSPHQGAKIVNSTESNGEAQRWIAQGCHTLADSEIQTFVDTEWALDALLFPSKISSFTSKACDGLGNTVIPTMLYSVRKPTAQDYAIGAKPLAKLDSFARIDSMPVVTFYGVEKDPLIWRVAQSLTVTTDTVPSGNILYANPFGLNNDGAMAAFVSNKIASYEAHKIKQEARARKYRILSQVPIFHGYYKALFFHIAARADLKAIKYGSAKKWLENANPTWKRLIGVRKDSIYTSGYICECYLGYGQMHLSMVNDPLDCPPSSLQSGNSHNCIITPIVSHITIDEQSDGVVPVSSQIGYPGRRYRAVRMDNTNHMQQRNSTETRDRLNELFNGNYGDEFKLDKK